MRGFVIYGIIFILLFPCSINLCPGQTAYASKTILKNIGKEILSGKDVSKINEKYLYQLIDSILVSDSAERKWYLKVFRILRISVTGDITQEVGFSEKEYVEQFSNEAFNMPTTDLISYARDIGEIFRTEEENPIQSVKEYILKIKESLTQLNCQKIDIFSKSLFDSINEKTK